MNHLRWLLVYRRQRCFYFVCEFFSSFLCFACFLSLYILSACKCEICASNNWNWDAIAWRLKRKTIPNKGPYPFNCDYAHDCKWQVDAVLFFFIWNEMKWMSAKCMLSHLSGQLITIKIDTFNSFREIGWRSVAQSVSVDWSMAVDGCLFLCVQNVLRLIHIACVPLCLSSPV